MLRKSLLYTLLLFCSFSCSHPSGNTDSKKSGTVTITAEKDSCFYLHDATGKNNIKAYRKIVIIKNTFTDTVSLGFAILYPGFTGEFLYLRSGVQNNELLYSETDEKLLPKTTMLCINLYRKRPVNGAAVVKYYY